MDGTTGFANNPALNDFLSMRAAAGIPSPSQMGDAASAALKEQAAAAGASAAGIKKGIKERDALLADMPAAPKPPKLNTNLPDAPQQQYRTPTQAFSTLAPVLAVFGSLLTRRPMVTAMNAAAAAMKGFHQGDKEVVDREREKWLDNMDRALKQNQLEIDQYREALEEHSGNMAALTAKMNAIAANNQDWHTLAALQAPGGAAAAFERLKTMQDAGDKLMKEFTDYRKSTTGVMDENDYANWKTQPQNIAKADAYDKSGGSDTSALVRGRGAQAAQELNAIQKLARERHPNSDWALNAQKYKAGQAGLSQRQRSIEQRAVPVENAMNEMDTLAEPLITAFKRLDPSKYPDWNSVRNAYARGTGGADIVKANEAMRAYLGAVDQLITRNGASTDASREMANSLLKLNFNVGQVEGFVDQSKITGRGVLEGLNKTREGSTPQPAAGDNVIHWDDLP